MLDDDGNGLVGRIVDNHQALERAPGGNAVEDEIPGPDLVGAARTDQRLPFAHRNLLAPAAPHLQLLERVQPLDPLVIDELAGLPQLQIDHPRSVATMPLRQGDDPLAQ